MNFVPITLEGRGAWLLSVLAFLGSFSGLGMLFLHGPNAFSEHVAAQVFFPFATLSARWAESFWNVPLLLLFFQFPLYAVVLTVSGLRDRLRSAVVVIGALHLAAALITVIAAPTEFS